MILAFQGKKQDRARELPDNSYRPTEDGRFEQVPNDMHKLDALGTDIGGVSALVLKPS